MMIKKLRKVMMSMNHMIMLMNVTQLKVMSWKSFQSELILHETSKWYIYTLYFDTVLYCVFNKLSLHSM